LVRVDEGGHLVGGERQVLVAGEALADHFEHFLELH
jgi:ABC-type branched-subunit amino acid transport system ATPase component